MGMNTEGGCSVSLTNLNIATVLSTRTVYHQCAPDGAGLEECKAALHEEDEVGHDEQATDANVFRHNLGGDWHLRCVDNHDGRRIRKK